MSPMMTPTVLTEVSSNWRITTEMMIQEIPATTQSHQYPVVSRGSRAIGGVPTSPRAACSPMRSSSVPPALIDLGPALASSHHMF